ncbi:hypothetical protein ABE096_19350 [Robertmurraya massiliosenegalensis]|uniref:hypothetical protein n=1 Tax=Robertmurraya TaxID=2837507 RepID=UPI0039A6CA5F
MNNFLPPKGDFQTFSDEDHYAEKVKEWGLSSTKEVKKEFWYKTGNLECKVTIKGYEIYGKGEKYNTLVIEFDDGNLSCIHPAYLKEMQASSFTKTVVTNSEKTTVEPKKEANQTVEKKATATSEKALKKEKKAALKKIDLPLEKVHFSAEVQQFAYSWNHFNEENDEVIVLKDVVIVQEPPIEIGLAWCSHSKTLKKFELSPGNKLEFDGKIVKKKLPNGKDVEDEYLVSEPVPYKINNPSKIVKSE